MKFVIFTFIALFSSALFARPQVTEKKIRAVVDQYNSTVQATTDAGVRFRYPFVKEWRQAPDNTKLDAEVNLVYNNSPMGTCTLLVNTEPVAVDGRIEVLKIICADIVYKLMRSEMGIYLTYNQQN